MILAMASGKGGTGKTTVAVNLARVSGSPVRLLDCDVEEPNTHLFLTCDSTVSEEVVSISVPEVDETLCDGCAGRNAEDTGSVGGSGSAGGTSSAGNEIRGECAKFCEYHAIVSFGTLPLVFPEMCHGCGGCMRVCPRKAISEKENRIGLVTTMQAGNITLVQGRLDVGKAMAPPLIREVKDRAQSRSITKAGASTEAELVIIDAPPGTSCPVVTAVRDADAVVLVTEPTPFGLNDLELAVRMIRSLSLPFGVVINRLGIGDDRVYVFCKQENIPIFAEIPDDRRIAEAYSRGKLIVDDLPEYTGIFQSLLKNLRDTAVKSEYE